ncbi:MAG: hypothetical protein V1900_00100 [Candidatus Aenigmatarchaeota archaeon]
MRMEYVVVSLVLLFVVLLAVLSLFLGVIPGLDKFLANITGG